MAPHQICGDDCRYRKLYEGSQRSLSDMAGRQAQAVARVGRLRGQIVLACKRAFPRAFTDAERAMGMRMSDTGDEVLVAYLENFLNGSAGSDVGGSLEAVRAALTEIGIPVPDGYDLADWADAIRLHGIDHHNPFATPVAAPPTISSSSGVANRALTAPVPGAATVPHGAAGDATTHAPAVGAVTPAAPATEPDPAAARTATPPITGSATTAHGSASSGEPTRHGVDLPTHDDLGGVVGGGGDLDDLFGEEDDLFGGGDGPFGADDDLFGGEGDLLGAGTGPFGTDDDLFGDGSERGGSSHPLELDSAVGLDPTVGEDPSVTIDQPGDELDDLFSPTAPIDRPVAAASDGDSTNNDDLRDSRLSPDSGSTTKTPSVDTPPIAAGEPEPLPAWATGKTVKPQLFPAVKSSSKREKRTSRVRAMPADIPDVPVTDAPTHAGDELTDEVRTRLLALASIPRPVFTADLVAALGSEDLVQRWRQEWQDGDLTVRFVLPKPRHRHRGPLVVPQSALQHADSSFAGSWWGRCMERYRGARLYELGVFFHRFADQVISFDDDRGVISVRMSLPQGLTGAVLVADTQLGEGGATREVLCDVIERFLGDRLVHIAVLVMNAEQFEPVAEAVESAAQERRWRAAMPVTLSRSWEYTDGVGTAVPLLGV